MTVAQATARIHSRNSRHVLFVQLAEWVYFHLVNGTLDELLGILQAELYMDFLGSISGFCIPDDLEKIVRLLTDAAYH